MKKLSDYGGGLVIVKMVGATAAPSRGRRRRLRRLRLLLLPPGKTLRLASNHTIIIHRHCCCCSGVGSLIGKKLHSQVSTMEKPRYFSIHGARRKVLSKRTRKYVVKKIDTLGVSVNFIPIRLFYMYKNHWIWSSHYCSTHLVALVLLPYVVVLV